MVPKPHHNNAGANGGRIIISNVSAVWASRFRSRMLERSPMSADVFFVCFRSNGWQSSVWNYIRTRLD